MGDNALMEGDKLVEVGHLLIIIVAAENEGEHY